MTKFVDIDVEDLASKIDNFYKMANVCYINMKGNKMALHFKHQVETFRSTLPIVTYLRDDNL
jgi:hypothetical protein